MSRLVRGPLTPQTEVNGVSLRQVETGGRHSPNRRPLPAKRNHDE